MIRRAERADAGAVHALIAELGYDGLDRAAFDRGFAEVLSAPGQEVWVAERDASSPRCIHASWVTIPNRMAGRNTLNR